jgi:hypothetical protein
MTDAPQPTAGSLEAKIIRACAKHQNKCKLDCPRRKVEDLGQVASFRTRPRPTLPNPNVGLKTGKPASETGPSLFEQAEEWLKRITHPGGSPK